MIKEIAKLTVDSIFYIKNSDVPFYSLIDVLPNYTDNLSLFYSHIYDYVINAFLSKPLLLSQENTYVEVSNIRYVSKKISALFSTEEIFKFTAKRYHWMMIPASNSRAYKFLLSDDLNIAKLDFWDIIQILKQNNSIEKYLDSRSDKWLTEFYELLSENYSYDKAGLIKNVRFIRGDDNKLHMPNELFLYNECKTSKVLCVKKCFLEYEN